MSFSGKAAAAKRAWRDGGLRGFRHALWSYRRRLRDERDYRRWMKRHRLTDERRKAMSDEVASFVTKPAISIVLPVYNVDEKWLRRCIESVIRQIYPHWELCVADDASTAPHIKPVLDEYAGMDGRIRITYRAENGHISAASNSALELASGDFVVLLDHDDELSEDALFWVAKELNDLPDTAVIYSDEDLIDERGRRFAPKFKPDFSRDLFYSLNLLTHLSAFRTELVRRVGGFRTGFEGSQDYDLGLRVLEQIDDTQIRHIPRVLYHWRVIRGSVAFSMDEKPYAHERARDAIREHFRRTGVSGEVFESFHNLHRVRYSGTNASHEIIPAVPGATARELNEAAGRSQSDVLVFLDRDLRVASADAIEEIVAAALQPGIGAASGRILTNEMLVESAGIILQSDLSPAFAHRGFPSSAAGNIFRNRQVANFSSVPVACMAIRRDLFLESGGFDGSVVPAGLFDVDLCLRLRENGKRIVVLPHAEFIRDGRFEGRQYDGRELLEFQDRWRRYMDADPFCNPNLKRDGSFEIYF